MQRVFAIAPNCIVPFLASSDLRKGIGAANYTRGLAAAGVITPFDEHGESPGSPE